MPVNNMNLSGLQADRRACSQASNALLSCALRAAQGRGAGEWRPLLSQSSGPHE